MLKMPQNLSAQIVVALNEDLAQLGAGDELLGRIGIGPDPHSTVGVKHREILDRCVAWAKAQPHPEVRDRTIWEMFEAERPSLVPYRGAFDGFHAVQASPSKTCLVRFDTNKYSVSAAAGLALAARHAAHEAVSVVERRDQDAGDAGQGGEDVRGRRWHGSATTRSRHCWRGSRAR